jgi:hypothetical protein
VAPLSLVDAADNLQLWIETLKRTWIEVFKWLKWLSVPFLAIPVPMRPREDIGILLIMSLGDVGIFALIFSFVEIKSSS